MKFPLIVKCIIAIVLTTALSYIVLLLSGEMSVAAEAFVRFSLFVLAGCIAYFIVRIFLKKPMNGLSNGLVVALSIVVILALINVMVGYIKDVNGTVCSGIMGGTASCLDMSLFDTMLVSIIISVTGFPILIVVAVVIQQIVKDNLKK